MAPNGTTWTNIAGATGANFTPNDLTRRKPAHRPVRSSRSRVTYTDNEGFAEELFSAPTGVVGDAFTAIPVLLNTFDGTAGDDIANGISAFYWLRRPTTR